MFQNPEYDYLQIYDESNPLYIHSASMQAVSKKVSIAGMQYLESLIKQGIIKIVDES